MSPPSCFICHHRTAWITALIETHRDETQHLQLKPEDKTRHNQSDSHTHTNGHAHTLTHTHTHTTTHTHTVRHTQTHTVRHTHTHTHTHTQTQSDTHRHTHSHAHTHTLTHTHTHSYAHRHTHTHRKTCSYASCVQIITLCLHPPIFIHILEYSIKKWDAKMCINCKNAHKKRMRTTEKDKRFIRLEKKCINYDGNTYTE